MKKLFYLFRDLWKKLGISIANFTSTVILIIFYYSIFAFFALVYSFIQLLTKKKNINSNFLPRIKTVSALEDLKREF